MEVDDRAKAIMAMRDTLICIEHEDYSHLQKAETLIRAFESCLPKRELLSPKMPAQELRLHMGELTAEEVRVARAAIAWANTRIEGEK